MSKLLKCDTWSLAASQMLSRYPVFCIVLLLGQTLMCARADSTFVYAVQLSATVQSSLPQITLSWEPDPYGANSYAIYRKAKEDSTWGQPLATLPGEALGYTDTAVAVGSAYEYKLVKAATLGYTGYGYIYSGIQVPIIDQRGKLLLVVAGESTSALTNEVDRLESDLIGDGWQVARLYVSTNDTPEMYGLLSCTITSRIRPT